MVQSYPELNERVHSRMKDYATESPDIMQDFTQLHNESMIDGAISKKAKELIALGIAICIQCDGCIALHIHDALEAGANHDEIVDAIGVAILMGGSPSVVYGSQALNALKGFEIYGRENWGGM